MNHYFNILVLLVGYDLSWIYFWWLKWGWWIRLRRPLDCPCVAVHRKRDHGSILPHSTWWNRNRWNKRYQVSTELGEVGKSITGKLTSASELQFTTQIISKLPGVGTQIGELVPPKRGKHPPNGVYPRFTAIKYGMMISQTIKFGGFQLI